MRNIIIAGNWKMNLTISEAVELINSLTKILTAPIPLIKVVVCPPFINLLKIKEISSGSPIHLGAQNCFSEMKGAYTGEVSVNMLKAVGCEYIIVGHSERRAYFNETDEFINKKLKIILSKGINPILCIGEKLEDRKNNNTSNVLKEQLDGCLEGIDSDGINNIIIAYEPVWAIGTGISATITEIVETHSWIRNYFLENFDEFVSNQISILYGGSMNEKNAMDILSQSNVDGGLIGNASLNSESFLSIINVAKKIKNSDNYITPIMFS